MLYARVLRFFLSDISLVTYVTSLNERSLLLPPLDAKCNGFKVIFSRRMLYARVLWYLVRSPCYAQGF